MRAGEDALQSRSPVGESQPEGLDQPSLRLLLVATRQHLATPDLRALLNLLRTEDCGFQVALEIADPARAPELLELHRLVATPALVKLDPPPRHVFAGNTLTLQMRSWLPQIGRAHV